MLRILGKPWRGVLPRHDGAAADKGAEAATGRHVCIHVAGTARTDVRLMRVANSLRQAGLRITVVDLATDSAQPRAEVIDGIRFQHLHIPKWQVRTRFKPLLPVKWAWLLMMRTAVLLRIPANVYHASVETALAPCYFAARIRRRPLVFESYELPVTSPYYYTSATRRALRVVHGELVRLMLRRCSTVLTVSEPIAREMQRRYGGPAPVVLRNLPPYQAPRPSAQLHQRLGLPAATRIALYQGLVTVNRSLEIVVQAGRYLAPGQVIVLLGDGSSRAALHTLIHQERLSDRVFLLPAVPYHELLRWTASADLGLTLFSPAYSTSIRYSLPNKLFEYLMAGLPVLTTPLEAIVAVVERYDVGAVVPSTAPEVVGAAIRRLLADEPGRARLRANALRAARELCWEREQQRLLQVYAALLAPPQKMRTAFSPTGSTLYSRGNPC